MKMGELRSARNIDTRHQKHANILHGARRTGRAVQRRGTRTLVSRAAVNHDTTRSTAQYRPATAMAMEPGTTMRR